MKKFNFKALLVLLLSLVMIFSFAACDEPEPPIEEEDGIMVPFNEFLASLDSTIVNISDLTDRFEADLDLFANIDGEEYEISIKGTVDLNVDADNADNVFAIEVYKDDAEVVSVYYNGADNAFFLSVPSADINRYMTGFEFLDALAEVERIDGGFTSQMPDISLVALLQDMSFIVTMLFEDYETEVVGGITYHTFVLSDRIQGLLGMVDLGDIAPAIPEFEGQLVVGFNDDGVKQISLEIDTYNSTKTEVTHSIQAGVKINKLLSAGNTYTLDMSAVPSTEDSEYSYFSPLNLDTRGTIAINSNTTIDFDIITDVNPFAISEAEAFVNIQVNDDVIFKMITVDGDFYVDVYDEESDSMKYYTLSADEALAFVEEVVAGLGNLEMSADSGQSSSQGDQDILGLVMTLPNVLTDDGIYIDKAFVSNALESLAIEDVELPEDLELVVNTNKDTEGNIESIRAEFYLKTVVDPLADPLEYNEDTYYLDVDLDSESDTYTISFGKVVEDVDVDELVATIILDLDVEDVLVGFDFALVNVGSMFTNIDDLNVVLSGFEFTWTEEVTMPTVSVDTGNTYVNPLVGLTAQDVIDMIQSMIDGEEQPQEPDVV